MTLYLIRHGETDWNRQNRRQGHTDIPLNDTGRSQSRHAAKLLGALCPQVQRIYCSPLSRALESAQIISNTLGWENIGIKVEPLLIERHFGESEGLLPEERRARFPDEWDCGMEPTEMFSARAQAVCEKILQEASENDNVLIVSHYVMLSTIIDILTEGRVPKMHMEQGSVYRILHQGEDVQVAKFTLQEY